MSCTNPVMLQTSLTVFTKNINDMRFDDVHGDGLPGSSTHVRPYDSVRFRLQVNFGCVLLSDQYIHPSPSNPSPYVLESRPGEMNVFVQMDVDVMHNCHTCRIFVNFQCASDECHVSYNNVFTRSYKLGVYIYTYMYVYIYTYMYIYMCVCVCVCVFPIQKWNTLIHHTRVHGGSAYIYIYTKSYVTCTICYVTCTIYYATYTTCTIRCVTCTICHVTCTTCTICYVTCTICCVTCTICYATCTICCFTCTICYVTCTGKILAVCRTRLSDGSRRTATPGPSSTPCL